MKEISIAEKLWPGPFSIECELQGDFAHLTPTGFNAFRIPEVSELRVVLQETGPIIATSANLHNQPYAENITEAQTYFTDMVDFYVDGGIIQKQASTLVSIKDGDIKIIRKGDQNPFERLVSC